MLVYYIDKYVRGDSDLQLDRMLVNITIVGAQNVTHQYPHKEQNPEVDIEKRAFTLCGLERQFKNIVDATNLQFDVKQFGVYFGEMQENLSSGEYTASEALKFMHPFESVWEYGLSHYAATSYFDQISQLMNNSMRSSKRFKLSEMTMRQILKKYIRNDDFESNGIQYLSEKIGLDDKYIKNFIFPVVWGSYLHEPNVMTTMLKLLPIYCNRKGSNSQTLVLFEDTRVVKSKILEMVKYVKINYIQNMKLEGYSEVRMENDSNKKSKTQVILIKDQNSIGDIEEKIDADTSDGYTSSKMEKIDKNSSASGRITLNTDLLFIFEEYYESTSIRQISYYKTIVDGYLNGDDKFKEDFFTMYMRVSASKLGLKEDGSIAEEKKTTGSGRNNYPNQIYTITRICS